MPSPTQGMQPTDHPDQHPNIRGVGRSHLWALTFFALPIASDLAVQLREAARSLSSGRRQQGPCSACVGSEARSVGHGMPVRNCRVLSFLVADHGKHPLAFLSRRALFAPTSAASRLAAGLQWNGTGRHPLRLMGAFMLLRYAHFRIQELHIDRLFVFFNTAPPSRAVELPGIAVTHSPPGCWDFLTNYSLALSRRACWASARAAMRQRLGHRRGSHTKTSAGRRCGTRPSKFGVRGRVFLLTPPSTPLKPRA